MFKRLFIALMVFVLAPVLNGYAEQKSQRFDIKIEHRKVVGQKTIRIKQGDKISLKWTTDEKVKVHLHGYDIKKTITPGKAAEMSLTGKATGRFPVTSHGFGKSHGHGKGALLYLEVHPK